MFDTIANQDKYFNETMQYILENHYQDNVGRLLKDWVAYFEREERFEDCALLQATAEANGMDIDLEGYEPKTLDMEALYAVCYEYTMMDMLIKASERFSRGEITEADLEELTDDVMKFLDESTDDFDMDKGPLWT